MAWSDRTLCAAAALAVLALVLLSDPSPPAMADLSSAQDSAAPVLVVCQVISVQERENGWTLGIADAQGGRAQAFLSRALGLQPPPVAAVVEMALEASDRPGFFFIRGIGEV